MFAAETECRKSPSHLSLLLLFRFVGSRDTHNLETDDAAREVTTAVGTADAGVDAGCEEGVAGLKSR